MTSDAAPSDASVPSIRPLRKSVRGATLGSLNRSPSTSAACVTTSRTASSGASTTYRYAVALLDAGEIAFRVPFGREQAAQDAHAARVFRIGRGVLDLAHRTRELVAAPYDRSRRVVRREALGLGEDARQARPDRLRGNGALEDVLVKEDDRVGRREVLAHGVVLGVDHHVRFRLCERDDLVEVPRLPLRLRTGQHEYGLVWQRLDDFPIALACEEESGRREDELVRRQSEFRSEPPLFVGAPRKHRVL